MSYDVQVTETFQKSIIALKKKYPHVKNDLLSQIKILEEDPSAGDPIPGWHKEIWKVRVASSDVKKGKRGAIGSSTFGKREKERSIFWLPILKVKRRKSATRKLKPCSRSSMRNWKWP